MTNVTEMVNDLTAKAGVSDIRVPDYPWVPTALIIITLILGIVYCFFGFKAVKFLSTLVGFCIGLGIGYAIASTAKLEQPLTLVVPIIGAVMFAILGFFLYRIGVFLVVLLAVSSIASSLLLEYTKLDETVVMIAALVVGVILSILCVVYLRPIVIISTALAGGLMFSNELFENLIKVRWSPQVETIVRLGVGVILALIGMIYQFQSTKNYVDSED